MPANEAVQLILDKAAELATDPNRFSRYEHDPLGFSTDCLGVTLTPDQQRVLLALTTKPRVAVRSGHSVGKTVLAAIAILWWLYCRRGLIVSTAPTWEHVADVLWREINQRHANALVPLPGRCVQTELRIANDWYAVGLSTNKPSAFQGRHHPRLLVVVDEATGVSEQVHMEIGTLATDPENCILMIGNPTLTSGTFYEAFKPESPWEKIHISCMTHPNVLTGTTVIPGAVSREWIAEKERTWGKEHPFWFSRVLGEFPRISVKGVIPLAWIERAINEEERLAAIKLASEERVQRIGGLDVARYGDNRCVYTQRLGNGIERIQAWSHLSLMETADRGLALIEENELQALVVDASGIGAGVVDRLLQLNAPVVAYNGGHRAFTPSSFSNRRTEMWWAIRQRLERQALWVPKIYEYTDQLVSDLIAPEYEITSSGRIKIDTKEDLLKRGIASPDFADSLVLCFALDDDPLAPEPVGPAHNQDPEVFELITEDGGFPTLPEGF
ncbi:MAG TPA: hypothetical protein VMX15_06420 [Candidatus Heimdallarchaeota archaeon]|nr:hypothetical protein [Candidatus Heimdallarchaeota archaeon]